MFNFHHQSTLPVHPRHPGFDVSLRLDEILLVESLEDIVEAGDHLCREVYELKVELPVELFYVSAVDGKTERFCHLQIVQLGTVDLLRHHLPLDRMTDLELKDESFHPGHRSSDVDGSPIDMLALLRLHLHLSDALRLQGSERTPKRCLSEVGVRIADHRLFIEQPPKHAHIHTFKK